MIKPKRNKNERDTKAFEELMGYKNTVFQICLGFSIDPYDAEDLTQEVYIKAYLKLGSIRNNLSLKKWLIKITRNTCIDHVRKIHRMPLFRLESEDNPIDWKTPEIIEVHREKISALKTAVHQLPKKQRDIFILKEYAHLHYKEIAEALGIKEGTVMSRLNRARLFVIEKIRGKNNENK